MLTLRMGNVFASVHTPSITGSVTGTPRRTGFGQYVKERSPMALNKTAINGRKAEPQAIDYAYHVVYGPGCRSDVTDNERNDEELEEVNSIV
jgi:hypothetical protein